ncbi:MAG: site-specific integrase [Eubacteriales bacterium]|nr:site-specific integrase [Eubacteriales bacterium]
MSIYKDDKTGKWYCIFRYTDWTGKRKQVKKAGFEFKREAAAYERDFLERQSKSPDILFKNLFEVYIEDCSHRLKITTLERKKNMARLRILPYFGELPINQIAASDVRKWQNELIGSGEYSQTYLKALHNELSAIFNYAMKYYGLHTNPARVCGSMGKKDAGKMEFWTKAEFDLFIATIERIDIRLMFLLLFYTGMRSGELLALTGADFDFTNSTVEINKTFTRLKKEDIITEPKTEKSNRIITLPPFILSAVKEYIECIYDYDEKDRLFITTKHLLHDYMVKGSKKANIKQIRIHDLRHSHASLLIEMGFQPMIISERLGHENITTTLQTYGHLYPNKQEEIALKLEKLQ